MGTSTIDIAMQAAAMTTATTAVRSSAGRWGQGTRDYTLKTSYKKTRDKGIGGGGIGVAMGGIVSYQLSSYRASHAKGNRQSFARNPN
jgi:hypothetical protein